MISKIVQPKPAHLRNSLDKDIYQIVSKLLEKEDASLAVMTVGSVYSFIQRSNSSLKRRPKILLEASIDRILSVMQQDSQVASEQSDSDTSSTTNTRPLFNETPANAMNKRMANGWQLPARPHEDDAATAPEATPTTEKKRSLESTKPQKERASKRSKITPAPELPPSHLSFDDIGGMDHVIESFKMCLLLPLTQPQRYMQRGLKIPRGILLHGPPGCGKTLLAAAIAAEHKVAFLQVSAPSIVSGMSGESEKQLRQQFEKAKQMAPCIMFIDEIDAIAPKRESAQREMERRIVAQFLTSMDDLALEKTGGKPVIVLAATNRPDSLDPALRRAGRFEIEINIGVPGAAVREKILRVQTRNTSIAEDVDFARLAHMTPGYVGADLESLIRKAGEAADKRYLAAMELLARHEKDTEMREGPASPQIPTTIGSYRCLVDLLSTNTQPPTDYGSDTISMADFIAALPHVQPSAKREGFTTVPDTTWRDIGALQAVRRELHSAIVDPIQNPAKYERFGLTVPAGVLLYGPPGCGKTLLAKAVANSSQANFISVKGPELLNKFVGESERAVRQVFLRARSSIPCIIFFDELDALVPRRDDTLSEASARVVNMLLTELDGIGVRAGVYVIAATNRPDMIDPAMLRPGRLGKHLFVGLPEAEERVEILRTLLRKMPADADALAEFGRGCEGFSGADLGSLVHEAAQHAIGVDAAILTLEDLHHAKQAVQPSVQNAEQYDKFNGGLAARTKIAVREHGGRNNRI